MSLRASSPRTRIALICAALSASGTAVAADLPTPMACGANGCMRLPTATLQGLLTLPEALPPAEPPRAQQYVLFRVLDLHGATHEVVYVPRDDAALLGFAGVAGWRLVPADDAKLLADAAAGRTPYPAPTAGAPVGRLFAPDESRGWHAGWLAVALAGVAAVAVAAYMWTTARRSR